MTRPTLDDIRAAGERLTGVAQVTPVHSSGTLSNLVGRSVSLKAENLQLTGSFKIRGAYNTIAQLTEAEREAGRRHVECREPRAGGGVGGAAGGDRGDDLRSRRGADGQVRRRRGLRRNRDQRGRGLRRGGCGRAPACRGDGRDVRARLRQPPGDRRAGDARASSWRSSCRRGRAPS